MIQERFLLLARIFVAMLALNLALWWTWTIYKQEQEKTMASGVIKLMCLWVEHEMPLEWQKQIIRERPPCNKE